MNDSTKKSLVGKEEEIKKEKKRFLVEIIQQHRGILEDMILCEMEVCKDESEISCILNSLSHRIEDKIGTIVKYNNGGGQSGVRDNPDVKTLIAYQKNITAITKQLLDLVPAKSKSKLQEFLNG